MNIINEIQKEITTVNEMPSFSSGDTITVSYKIKEGNKERIQQFQGVVTQPVIGLRTEGRNAKS